MTSVPSSKRLIGVVTVKGDWAVQSFGYNRYLPMGRPRVLMENLDRWGADEILLNCIDRGDRGPHLELLGEIARTGITTPVIYGGGIRSEKDAVASVGAGADRVVVDAGWRSTPESVAAIHQGVGAQAVIASVPSRLQDEALLSYDYNSGTESPLPSALMSALHANLVSEVIVTDWRAEGTEIPFDLALLERFPTDLPQLIAFGGLSDPDIAARTLAHPRCVAVAVGNYLSYREHAVQTYKSAMMDLGVRPPQFYQFRTEQPIHAPDL